jgi:hypothetical protein
MVTTQKNYLSTNLGHVAKAPCATTVAQIDQALRDFVLQDTTHLRSDAEAATSDSQREPEFVRHMAGASLIKLDETIADLRRLRDFLHAEGERIKRELSGYLQLNYIATDSTKRIVDNIAQLKKATHSTLRAPGPSATATDFFTTPK